jgi:hypothetical protein
MPDWDNNELREIKDFIITFTKALNTKNYQSLGECFEENAVLHRAMENYIGRNAIIEWYKSQLNAGDIQFGLMDATAGVFPDSSAKCILWYEITARGYGKVKKDICIETMDLVKKGEFWKIRNCFGMGYSPKEHKRSFS